MTFYVGFTNNKYFSSVDIIVQLEICIYLFINIFLIICITKCIIFICYYVLSGIIVSSNLSRCLCSTSAATVYPACTHRLTVPRWPQPRWILPVQVNSTCIFQNQNYFLDHSKKKKWFIIFYYNWKTRNFNTHFKNYF